VPSAGAAAGASAAGVAGASAAAGAAGAASVVAGGAAAVSGLAASCFAQAVSISAATSALRASLVFIDRYPKEKQEWYENDMNEFGRSASPLRIAAVNSIESPRDLKQSAVSCLSLPTSNGGGLCSPYNGQPHEPQRRRAFRRERAQHPPAMLRQFRGTVIWQACALRQTRQRAFGQPLG
jgi:hypothetical protein